MKVPTIPGEFLISRNGYLALAGLGVAGIWLVKRFWCQSILPANGKVVVVTGCGSTLGFGTAICRRFHDMGYVVFAGCLDAQTAREGIHRDRKDSPTFHVMQLDVTNQSQIDEAYAVVDNWLQSNPSYRLFGVVSNAGIASFSPIEWHTMETFFKVVDINCFGMVRVAKAFLPLLRRGGYGGRVVFMSSVAGEIPNPSAGPYCLSKSALLSVADCLALEVAQFGIKVSAICPDLYLTNMITDSERILAALDKEISNVPPEAFEAYGGERRVKVMKEAVAFVPTLCRADLTPVVDCTIHAVTSPNPRKRYYPIGIVMRFAKFLNFVAPSLLDFAQARLVTGI